MAALTPGDHYLEAGGIRFHYRVRGKGPVFIGEGVGWGPSVAYLWNLLAPLENHFTMVYFEPRGTGLSSRPADETQMTSEVMAHDLEHLRKHLGIDKFPVLFGHSNGACISLIYATLYPERVEKLVLLAAEINNDTPSDNFAKFAAARKDHPVYGPALQALMVAVQNPPDTDEEFAAIMGKLLPFYFNDTSKTAEVVASMEVDKVPPRAWALQRQGRLDREKPFMHVPQAAKIKAKTLILAGRDDAICSLQRSEELHEALADSELVVFECGHFPVVEKPQEFWAAVNQFLNI
ncbi:Alpha/Beta hydrolase protein [Echria macrotheca]|uniref:Alpha/Beta hydrolase protein n=1 Tax=Echria macrotheca TaxID=438768 RepID=A0AAJ0BCQ4_9PEZI|nr:Alpha/Beta hydrolase protein [Echria macrotheca]